MSSVRTSVRPSVRPSPLFTKKDKFKRKQCSLLWVWPSGSLVTPVLFYNCFVNVHMLQCQRYCTLLIRVLSPLYNLVLSDKYFALFCKNFSKMFYPGISYSRKKFFPIFLNPFLEECKNPSSLTHPKVEKLQT